MKIKALAVSLVLSITSLHGVIDDCFKPCPGKEINGPHSIRNVDFIYTINLDKRPEKFKTCTDQLNPYGIYPYRFSAVNGWEITLETINTLGVKFEAGMDSTHWGTSYLVEDEGKPHHELMHVIGRNYFSHCMARGAIGIVLSHLSVLQDAVNSGYDTIWVMEDDIQVIQNPHEISNLIDKLDALVGKKNWDILFTDQDTKNQKGEYVPCLSYAWRPFYTPTNPARFTMQKVVSPEFKRIGARYGAYSYIIRRSGMKKILSFIREKKIFLPYDMEFYLPNGIRIYAVNNDVISTQPQALSDNGAPAYKEKEKNLIK